MLLNIISPLQDQIALKPVLVNQSVNSGMCPGAILTMKAHPVFPSCTKRLKSKRHSHDCRPIHTGISKYLSITSNAELSSSIFQGLKFFESESATPKRQRILLTV